MWIIRKRIQLAPEKAIFLFVNKTIPVSRYAGHSSTFDSTKIFYLVQQWVRFILNIKMKIAFCILPMVVKIHLVKKISNTLSVYEQ